MVEAVAGGVRDGQLDLESLVELSDEEAVERLGATAWCGTLDRRVRPPSRTGTLAHLPWRRCGGAQRPDAMAQTEKTAGLPASPTCIDAMERLRRVDLLPSAARSSRGGEGLAMRKRTTKKSELYSDDRPFGLHVGGVYPPPTVASSNCAWWMCGRYRIPGTFLSSMRKPGSSPRPTVCWMRQSNRPSANACNATTVRISAAVPMRSM